MKKSDALICAYVYMVKCEDDSIYTGITKDIKSRMKEHVSKSGKGAKYTRSRTVKALLMVWEAQTYASAARLEYAIKRLNRNKKLKLIEEPELHIKEFFSNLESEIYIVNRKYIGDISELLCEDD